MSSPYLEWLIREQVDRTRLLRDEIPGNLRHAALGQLALRCRGILEEQARQLGQARALLDGAGTANATEALAIVKYCTQAIGEIEGYGMPPLHCQSDQAVFLNDVLSAMHHEVGLSVPLPAASCTSNNYYFTHLPTKTVYVPMSEAGFLLHLPDFYHELGHILENHMDVEAKYAPIRNGMANAIEAIDRHYRLQTGRTELGAAPAPARDMLELARVRWKYRWISEAFSDLFALFAVGPAYAYSNLHLVSKFDSDIYHLDPLARQDHPSGEARMRMLDVGMRMLGYADKAAHVKEEWDAMARHYDAPRPEYGRAFSPDLLGDIVSSILPTFGLAGLRGYRPDGGRGPSDEGATPVAALLNDAWGAFWRDGDSRFRDVERAMISWLVGVARRGAVTC